MSAHPLPAARAAAAALLLCSLACAERPPTRLVLDPSGPLHMTRKGQSETLKAAAFTENGRPYVRSAPLVFSSEDKSVATVSADGVVTATGSGETKIAAEAWGLRAEVQVRVQIVGTIEIAGDTPTKLRLHGEEHQLVVTVKDDKGNVIDKPPAIAYRADDYCIDVSPGGRIKAQAQGECSVVASVAGLSDRVKVQVR